MVCTPLRLVSLLRKGALTLASLEYLVLDEADKLLELGFLEQCDEVLAACDGATVQRCLFSATMPPAVEDLMHSVLPGPGGCGREERGGGHGGAVAPSSAGARTAGSSRWARWCARGWLRPPLLIFVQSVERAMQLFHALVYDGLHEGVLHAERTAARGRRRRRTRRAAVARRPTTPRRPTGARRHGHGTRVATSAAQRWARRRKRLLRYLEHREDQ